MDLSKSPIYAASRSTWKGLPVMSSITRTGGQTTEFKMTIAAYVVAILLIVASLFVPGIPAELAGKMMDAASTLLTGSTGAYALARGIFKAVASRNVPFDPLMEATSKK